MLVLTALFLSSPASAATVRSSSGATAEVSPTYAHSFQCLVSALDREGYRIDFMGGYRRHGSVPGSLHPSGGALDINQLSRGRVTRPLPRDATTLARSCGLLHGAVWRHQDQGHFQAGRYAAEVQVAGEADFTWHWPSLAPEPQVEGGHHNEHRVRHPHRRPR